MKFLKSIGVWGCAMAVVAAAQVRADSCVTVDGDNAAADAPVIAVANGMRIGDTEFQASIQIMAREKFYHFNLPEGEAAQFQREVINSLVDARLLAKEAQRRGIAVDLTAVDAQLEQMDATNRENPAWAAQRDQVLAFHRCRSERLELLDALKSEVEAALEISDTQVVEYYREHADKFTSPPQFKVQVIVLGVDPSMPSSSWQAAEEQAKTLYIALSDGADFAELAMEFSTDASAGDGGEMGYIHQGMLGSEVEAVLEKLAIGEIAEPMRVLEGWIIVRLDDRIDAELNPLEKVYDRAAALAKRDALEVAWKELAQKLRSESDVRIEEQRLLPLPESAPDGVSQG